jgi:hypothetical protein
MKDVLKLAEKWKDRADDCGQLAREVIKASKITKVARIGATAFHPGISVTTVLERAYREQDYFHRAPFEAVRVNYADRFLQALHFESALAELVRLKGVADALDDHRSGKHILDDFERQEAQYKIEKPLAWKRAMELLAPNYPFDKEFPS